MTTMSIRNLVRRISPRSLAGFAIAALTVASTAAAQTAQDWPVHSLDRPQSPIVTPAPFAGSVAPPSDAIVLFNGHDLSAWRSDKGGPATWVVRDGHFEVAPDPKGRADIVTAQSFGDSQLHLEWQIPPLPAGQTGHWGNSGVFFGGRRYEIQIIDSYQYRDRTYADGQAGAIYGQYPPLVNASRAPGKWQTYDIIFHGPRFDAAGALLRPARVTILHNGVLVQDNATLMGRTAHGARPPYEAHPVRMPITIQEHNDAVRFRNIWIRELHEDEGSTLK